MRQSHIFLVLLVLLPLGVMAQTRTPFLVKVTQAELERWLTLPCQFQPVPKAGASFWQTAIPQSIREDYVQNALQYQGKSYAPIPDSLFSQFSRTGNRMNYERAHLAYFRQLASLVMGEVMEHRGRFIPDVVKGIRYFNNEKWWGAPAHYPIDHPEYDVQIVDLYNSDTAALLAWTIFLLRNDLEAYEPGLCESVRREIDRRMLTPCRTTDYGWKHRVTNWNTWICENWLSCILLCENNRSYQIEAAMQVLKCLSHFYENYPDDGGCDEGVDYWNRAAAAFFESISMLDAATNHRIEMTDDRKLRNMGRFVCNYYIGNNQFVNFADASASASAQLNVLYPYGAYVGDSTMMKYAAQMAQRTRYALSPADLFSRKGNTPFLSRELLFLYRYESFAHVTPAEPLPRDVWLPSLQVMAARSAETSTNGIFLSAKGGHNGETHNHNDIGNFIVYADADPILVDIGAATYTAQTFSTHRYELFNCRSAYHNVPIINGFEQHEGKEYHAKRVEYSQNENKVTFILDLAEAYVPTAAVRQWRRTLTLHRDREVQITEDYELSAYLKPSEIILISCGETFVASGGNIAVKGKSGIHYIHYNSSQLNPVVEKIRIDDPLLLRAWHNRPLYRIRLIIRSRQKKGRLSYSIH